MRTGFDAAESGYERTRGFRLGDEANVYFCNNSQSPFRSYNKTGDVISYHPFHGTHTGGDYFTGRQDHFQASYIIASDSVFQAVWTAGILSCVTSQARKGQT